MLRVNRIALATAALSLLGVHRSGAADDFRLTIGSPTAALAPATVAQGGASKKKFATSTVFVVRADGCPDPTKARIVGTAEGLVQGVRQSIPVILSEVQPGIYAVHENWPQGTWVVNLVGTYQNLKAGAVVPVGPIGPRSFIRESSRFFPRPATPAEVEAALKAHSTPR